MASDALSIPFDVPWKRVAFSRDMFDPRRGGSLPPKWRSSLAVYAYAVPLEQTTEDYPDSRIVYLKLTASITGWSESEALNDDTVLTPDDWVADAWDTVRTAAEVSEYWGCVCAFAQLAIFPRPETGVPIDDYPYVVDFEPKKRELYEAVTDTSERLSGTSNKLATGKSSTSTSGTEDTSSYNGGFSAVGFTVSGTATNRSYASSQHVDSTSADRSTERRETESRSTQLSQMYQVFNGYHLGTNRALFAMFPRPHIATDTAQVNNNLINGERKLEGIQDVFLVIHLPRTMPGFCIDAWLDTGNKIDFGPRPAGSHQDFGTPIAITRRYITGCAEFTGDVLRAVAPTAASLPPRAPEIIGEYEMAASDRFDNRLPGEFARMAPSNRAATADHLNLLAAATRKRALGFQMNEHYKARPYRETKSFRARLPLMLRATTVDLSVLQTLHYITAAEKVMLEAAGVQSSGDLFGPPLTSGWDKDTAEIRSRLIDAIIAAMRAKS